MSVRQRRYSKEELARRGKEWYESQIRQQVEADNLDKIVAIDIETGAFEIDKDTLIASDRLLARYPNAQTWFIRIGHQPNPESLAFDLQPHSPESIEQMVQILDEWMADDSGYDEATWADLKTSLNHHRENVDARRLFVD
jgi:hypothetical protein